MNPEEAIEILTAMKKVCRSIFPPKEQDAVSLGIEALKAWRLYRPNPVNKLYQLLPGETKE